MKVEVEKQPGSVSKLQIELPADEVAKEWDAIANSFARFAKIPGYRPGKAPRAVIDKRFRKEIQDELTKKLVSKSYHEAVEQEQLRVASLTNIEEIEFGEDKSMRFRATVVTAPEFELPDYKNIPVQLPDGKGSNAEVEAAIDDALAAKLAPGKTLAELRQLIEHDLEHAKEHDAERAKEAQIVKYLQERIQFELPQALLQNETRRALAELVQRNRERGVTDDMLKEKEKELIDAAAGMAAHRLKTNFILHRIAELENIQTTKEDLDLRVRQEAARYDISPEKMRKELQQRNALDDVSEQLLLGKTLDLLTTNF